MEETKERNHIFCEFCNAQGAEDPWHFPEEMQVEYNDHGHEIVKCQYEWQSLDMDKIWGSEKGDYEDLCPLW